MNRIIWISLLTFLVTSCTTMSPQQPPMNISWQNRMTTLQQLQSWQIYGKIAVQTTEESGSATVDWQQNQQVYLITLSGPLGATGLKLQGQPGSVTLETANGKIFHAASPEQLLAEQWGFNLPVSYLKFWVRGLPVPSLPHQSQFDAYHRLTDLTQQGWHIQYLSYTNLGQIDLPERISVTSSLLKAKMIIYNWKI